MLEPTNGDFLRCHGIFFRNEKIGKKKPVGDLAKEAMAQ